MAHLSCPWDMSPLTLVLMVAAFILSVIYLLWPYRIFKKMGVPGPTPLPLFGTFLHYSKGFRAFDEESFQRYGRVWGIYDGRLPVLMVADTNMLKQILVKDCLEFFTNHRKIGLNELFGEGLSTVDDEQWKRIRNILSPTFSSGKIKQMYPLILRCADVLVKNLHEKCQSGKSVDLKQTFGAYSMDVIASSAFSMDVDSQNNPNDPFVVNGRNIFKISLLNPLPIIITLFPVFVPLFEYMGLSLFPKKICIFFKNIVQQMKRQRQRGLHDMGRVDFLQLMVDAQLSETVQNGANPHSEKYLTDSELEAQAILFLLAGFETTSTAITFVAYCLACNPDVQTKVQQEIDEFLPDDKAPSYEILNEMEYLDMVVSETMRMYPPAARLDRVCKRTTTVDNLVIPKDVVITVSTWVLHYDPQHWEEPNEFRPERFTKEAKEARDPYCYLPFGQGPRNCIGMRFALMSVKIAVCRILQRYSFQMCSETTIPPKLAKGSILQTEKTLLLKVSERKKAD
uniref:Cytochrome P450 3A8-like isoform X3 n=1 Tax=Petromyzon marinus TaxID=7757 RepID=A0AAJ7X9D3_PETMA|nr:cytochrome P450 3A8-like isoform X3 [Petromyzon marinus]XP_032826369.1 cytochrome P450 3A8-like isoform X3 [Petromyzon marinus]